MQRVIICSWWVSDSNPSGLLVVCRPHFVLLAPGVGPKHVVQFHVSSLCMFCWLIHWFLWCGLIVSAFCSAGHVLQEMHQCWKMLFLSLLCSSTWRNYDSVQPVVFLLISLPPSSSFFLLSNYFSIVDLFFSIS